MDRTVETKIKFKTFLANLTFDEKQAFWRLLNTTYVVKTAKEALTNSLCK